MSIEFKLPAVGENIDKAEIGGLRVAVGDTIAAEQIVMEIETDKAVFELPCPTAGKVVKIHVKPGDTVHTGAPLLTIDGADGSAGGQDAPKQSQAAPSESTEAPGGVRPPDRPSPTAPPEKQLQSSPPESSEAPAGSRHAARQPQEMRPAASVAHAATVAKVSESDGDEVAPAPAGPATRRLARELGVDLHQVPGSGPGGRITSEDVQAYVRERLAAPAAEPTVVVAASGPGAIPPLPDFSTFGPIERQPLNKVTRT